MTDAEPPIDRWDVLVLAGVALVGTGLSLLSLWLGLAVAGALLVVLGVAGGTQAGRADAARPGIPHRQGG
jgi:hypothetical protein